MKELQLTWTKVREGLSLHSVTDTTHLAPELHAINHNTHGNNYLIYKFDKYDVTLMVANNNTFCV
jgi:hypothetical protein